jgi:hypothetical protein
MCQVVLMIDIIVISFGLQLGPYVWKTYKEVYDEVVHIGSALRASGAEPVSPHMLICQGLVI